MEKKKSKESLPCPLRSLCANFDTILDACVTVLHWMCTINQAGEGGREDAEMGGDGEEANKAPSDPPASPRADIIMDAPQPAEGPRMTTRYMTKYERARVLGTRALQIR